MITAGPSVPASVVVGRGRLGAALAAALGRAGRAPDTVSGRAAAGRPSTVGEALHRAGPGTLLLLAVRDDALETLARDLAIAEPDPPPGTVVLHLSGALGLDVLDPFAARGLAVGSCHPLQTFTGSPKDSARFRGATFAVDGEGEGRAAAERVARALGGRPVAVPRGSRGLYHLAASLGANGLTGLVAASRDALVAAGLEPEEALRALGPLLRTALEEATGRGPEAALTGPVARGDEATVERHRRALITWDAARAPLLEALLREQRRLAARRPVGTGW